MIRIYHAQIDFKKHERLLHEFLPGFPAAFREKIMRYRRWEDAQLSLLGRILLQKGLQQTSDGGEIVELEFNSYQKPLLKNSPVKFNISHAGYRAVCALTTGYEIGIDLELITPVTIEDFRSQMTSSEWKRIDHSHGRLISFYRYWTQKEALIKAHGKGLSLPLQSFEVVENQAVIDSERYYVKEIFIHNDYICAIASQVDLDAEEIAIFEISC